MKRSEAREKVFRIIFQLEFHDDFADMLPRLFAEEGLMGQDGPRGAQGRYANECIEGILGNIEKVDGLIRANLKGWSFERISKHVKALLRLGVYELCFNKDIPDVAAIDEAVTLSHVYCDEKEAQFVNGLLNNLMRSRSETARAGSE
jgi:N utilization substance protein B